MTLFLYLLRQSALATLFATLGLAFVVFPGVAVSAVNKLGGVSLIAVLQYIPMIGAELAPYLLSLGFLLGTVSTFGRLGSDREWIAIQMSGMHPWASMLPGLLLGVGLGFVTYFLSANLTPPWKYESSNFRVNALLEAFRGAAPGRTEIDFGKFYLGAESRDAETGAFLDVQVRVPHEDGTDRSFVAKSALLRFSQTMLEVQFEEMRSMTESGRFGNQSPRIQVPLDLLVERQVRDPTRPSYRTSSDMRAALAQPGLDPKLAASYRFEVHRRYALGFMFLIFLVVGAATGLWLQNGQLSGLGVAAVYAFVYYVLSMRLGSELAKSGALSPVLAAWSTNLLGMIVGIFCLRRVSR